ncbi:hypothetical protein [Prosthecobacter sp.]|uniref:hypothetical protein n=1 Tax=Prosthecobacter sp. TaxID=1965333 RepID=UPI0037841EF8
MPAKPPPTLEAHPGINASHITWYVTDRLKAGTINLYSAYLLMHEALRFERLLYLQSGWKQTLEISGLLDIYYDHITARALGCTVEADESADWFLADTPLLKEKRKHFLTDRLAEGKSLLADAAFHRLLADLRRRYDSLPDAQGPYPQGAFPFHLAAPELELLQPGSQPAFAPGQELDAESADFYVQLQLAR